MSFKFVLLCVLIRHLLGSVTPRQTHAILPGSVRRYKAWVKSKRESSAAKNDPNRARRLQTDVESVPGTQASIVWLGDRQKATKFVVYLHGGAFITPLSSGHIQACWNSYVAGGPGAKEEVAVALVAYTLCPKARYPEQLRETCAAVAMLLQRGISPRDMIFGGDSAGGALAIQFIRHVIEPHPGIDPLVIQEPFAGTFLLSPVVAGSTDTRSYQDHGAVDMISKAVVNDSLNDLFRDTQGASTSLSVSEKRALALPLEGDPAWLSRFDTVVNAVYLRAGKQEMFLDHNVQFAELLRRQCDKLELQVELAEKEAHDFLLLEGMASVKGEATRSMQQWATTRLT